MSRWESCDVQPAGSMPVTSVPPPPVPSLELPLAAAAPPPLPPPIQPPLSVGPSESPPSRAAEVASPLVVATGRRRTGRLVCIAALLAVAAAGTWCYVNFSQPIQAAADRLIAHLGLLTADGESLDTPVGDDSLTVTAPPSTRTVADASGIGGWGLGAGEEGPRGATVGMSNRETGTAGGVSSDTRPSTPTATDASGIGNWELGAGEEGPQGATVGLSNREADTAEKASSATRSETVEPRVTIEVATSPDESQPKPSLPELAFPNLDPPAADVPEHAEADACPAQPKLGTAIIWAETPDHAVELAAQQDKLIFLIQVSGNFAREEFT